MRKEGCKSISQHETTINATVVFEIAIDILYLCIFLWLQYLPQYNINVVIFQKFWISKFSISTLPIAIYKLQCNLSSSLESFYSVKTNHAT